MPPRTHIPTPIWIGIGLLLCGLTQGGETIAYADTTLAAVGQGRVSEIAHHREIEFGASSIEVVETITLANPGRLKTEAIYSFHLPAKAAIYEMTVANPEGGKSRYGVVEASAATRLIADPSDQSKPDLGLVRMVSAAGLEQDERGYELRVFPVPGQKSSTVRLRWRSPVSLVSGNYSVRIPGRGEESGLARSEVQLRTTMASTELHGGNKELARTPSKNKRYRFFAPVQGDLVIQAKARLTKAKANAEVALYPLSANTGVAAIRVVLPDAARGMIPRFKRALVLIDVSRSMGNTGLGAASKFVDGLLAQLGSGTQVEAILFHRTQKRVLGEMRGASASVRGQIVRKIRSASLSNGSDLKGALSLARTILEAAEADGKAGADDTLIAVVSDGVLASSLKGDEAVASLGPRVMGQSRILSAVLVPPDAPLPELAGSAISTLAYRGRGRVAALHYAAAALQGKALLGELSQPEPIDTLEVELDRGVWVGSVLRGTAAPGMSVTALGYYEGGTPRRVTITGLQGGERIRFAAQKLPRAKAIAFAQMTLADTSPDSFPGTDEAVENRRAFVRAAAKLGVITEASAGVVVDKKDGFASDRLDMATRWGGQYYRRLPPPAERDWKAHSFRPFEVDYESGYRADKDERTGQLDREIITRRVRTHAIPVARRCYDQLLRRNHEARGAVRLRIEISRGEVHQVEVARLAPSLEPIRDCIVNAIYGMPIPRVQQGSDPERINLVNYPLRFRLRKPGKGKGKAAGKIEEDDPTRIDTTDPLGGMPD